MCVWLTHSLSRRRSGQSKAIRTTDEIPPPLSEMATVGTYLFQVLLLEGRTPGDEYLSVGLQTNDRVVRQSGYTLAHQSELLLLNCSPTLFPPRDKITPGQKPAGYRVCYCVLISGGLRARHMSKPNPRSDTMTESLPSELEPGGVVGSGVEATGVADVPVRKAGRRM